jgi:hypothetical protein
MLNANLLWLLLMRRWWCRYGGYVIKTVKLDDTKSREQLLDMRSKKKSDRMCM